MNQKFQAISTITLLIMLMKEKKRVGGDLVADERLYLRNLGEYYTDQLRQEAFIKDSPLATQAGSMLRAYLNKRTEYRNKVLTYLAWKRRITLDELKRQIALGEAKQLSQAEFKELEQNYLSEEEPDAQK